jgi:hypothetical protein
LGSLLAEAEARRNAGAGDVEALRWELQQLKDEVRRKSVFGRAHLNPFLALPWPKSYRKHEGPNPTVNMKSCLTVEAAVTHLHLLLNYQVQSPSFKLNPFNFSPRPSD